MAPSAQTTASDLEELLNGAELAGEWILDPSLSSVSLKNRVWGITTVSGVFRQVNGAGTVSPTGEVSGAITVDAASVDTKITRRDNHLRSADFFDSANYPDLTFTVAGVRPSSQGVTVTGMLRVRDRTRPLTFDAVVAVQADGEVWLDAAVDIIQADFGLTWNFMGMVSTTTTIAIHAVFTKR
jgi:polyisoprenoid-binding protein YceI